MPSNLDTKIIAITGGASGIGLALAKRCAVSKAAHLCIADHDASALSGVPAIIRDANPNTKVHTAVVDVSKATEVERWVDSVLNKVGRVDAAANIAGIAQAAYSRSNDEPAIVQEDEGEWRRIMSVNLDGVFHCTKAQVRAMTTRQADMSQESGMKAIVNMSSLTSTVPIGDFFAYGTSKAALAHFSACVAKDVCKFGIRVNAISPAATETAMIPVFLPQGSAVDPASMKLLDPEDVAEVIVWLLSDESRHVSGVNLAVGMRGG